MRRVDRRRQERLLRTVRVVGISFALGALADAALTWRLHEFERATQTEVSAAASAVAPTPSDPQDVVAPEAVRTAQSAPRAAIATRGIAGHEEAVKTLRQRHLEIPVDGIKLKDLHDSFFEARSGHAHEALDFMAPRHTPVRAVDAGVIAKLFTSKAGGLTVYQFDPSGTFCYYYAHLDRYEPGLREGQEVRRGQTIGYVGSTGNASEDAPHLHFAILRLSGAKEWWRGDPVNPYAVFQE